MKEPQRGAPRPRREDEPLRSRWKSPGILDATDGLVTAAHYLAPPS